MMSHANISLDLFTHDVLDGCASVFDGASLLIKLLSVLVSGFTLTFSQCGQINLQKDDSVLTSIGSFGK